MGFNDDYVIDCHLNWSSRENGQNIQGMSCLLWKITDGKISKVYNFPEDQHLIDAFFNNNYRKPGICTQLAPALLRCMDEERFDNRTEQGPGLV